MSWQSKVMWSEGLFLQPHHFQQQDRYIETLAAGLASGLAPYGWGVQRLALDEEMLKLGKISASECTGLTPDGAYFRAPAIDDLPEALDVPDGVQNCVVYLALPTRRPGAVEVDATGEDLAARFRAAEVEITDTMGSDRRPVTVAVGKMRLQFALEVDDLADRLTIPVGRIIEKNSDGSVLMDKAFIASCLDARAAPPLHDFLNEMTGVLTARLDSLAGRLGEGGGPKAGGEIGDYLYLQLVNRMLPEMKHLLGIENAHPCTLYRMFVGLAGEVATFVDPAKRPPDFAPYRHDDLTATFQPVMRALRRYLSAETGPRATLIRLEPRKYGISVGLIPDRRMVGTHGFVLAARADVAVEALRRHFPGQVKIGPVEQIRQLVNSALPGIGLRPLPVAPRQVPYHAGVTYFELDGDSPFWQQLSTSGGLAVHVAGDFPGLSMELWAIPPG